MGFPHPAPSAQPDPQPLPVEAGKIESSLKIGTFAQVVIALIALIGLIYLLKLVLITTFVSILIAYLLEPLVAWMKRRGVPRALGALIAVTVALGVAGLLFYFAYNRGVEFLNHMPEYIAKVRERIEQWTTRAGAMTGQGRAAVQGASGRAPVTVEVREAPVWTRLISENTGTILETLLAAGFVPFLVYFMLSWKEHFQRATVWIFPREHRAKAMDTVGSISAMMRSYLLANFLIGLAGSAVLVAVFGLLQIPYFYFLGVISGFVSLIPYLGLFLAMVPPLAGGLGALSHTAIIIIVAAVGALHIIAVNVVYPKFVGKRLELNPVVVTVSLLFWSWIWGALGLILAIPLLGSTKIICDHFESLRGLGAWLGESGELK